jgi:signal transduction histidine kinase
MELNSTATVGQSVWLFYLIDGSILLFGLLSLIYLRKVIIGTRLGRTLVFVGLGMIAIAINHFIDFLFVHNYFEDKLLFGAQAASIVHHLGNLVGFFLIFIGYFRTSRVLLTRSLVYVLILLVVSLLYIFLYVTITRDFFHSANLHTDHEVLLAVATLLLAFLYHPIKQVITGAVDKMFLRYTYKTEQLLATVNQACISTYKLEELMDKILQTIVNNMRLSFADIVLFDEGKFYAVRRFGAKGSPNYAYTQLELLQQHNRLLVFNQMENKSELVDIKRVMSDLDIMAAAPLRTPNNFVGLITLGGKASGEILTLQDINALELVSPEISIAIANAKSVKQIENFNTHLQKEITKATTELRNANERLQQLDDSKDEFISMASHQLRTPLTTVKGYISMMLDGDMGEVPAPLKDAMQIAYSSAQRMVYLIADMLNVSRMNTGKLVFDPRPVDLNKVVEGEVKQLKAQAAARNIKFIYNAPNSVIPKLNLDEQKIGQVIMNMIDNAIYYAPNSTIEITLSLVDGKIRFTVADQGIGIPESEQGQLFTKFFRATNAKKIRPDGTGLGLYMAKIVVESQGGNVLFSSRENAGSIFGFEFPLNAQL